MNYKRKYFRNKKHYNKSTNNNKGVDMIKLFIGELSARFLSAISDYFSKQENVEIFKKNVENIISNIFSKDKNKLTKRDRKQLIENIIVMRISMAENDDYINILKEGFQGYENYSDNKLIITYNKFFKMQNIYKLN